MFAIKGFSKSFNYHSDLKSLLMPTLIVHSTSNFILLSSSQNIHNSLPDSKLVLVDECGHCSITEKPQEILKSIKEFLLQKSVD